MIRTATPDDIPRLVELGRVMAAESPRYRRFRYVPDRVAATAAHLMANDLGAVFVADVRDEGVVGGLMALAYPHFSCDCLQATDVGLFIHPEHRGGMASARLVRAYREWAKGIGAEASIGVTSGVQPARTGDLMAALGATQTGAMWSWPLPAAPDVAIQHPNPNRSGSSATPQHAAL